MPTLHNIFGFIFGVMIFSRILSGVSESQADSGKRGKSICTMGDCGLKDVPNPSPQPKDEVRILEPPQSKVQEGPQDPQKKSVLRPKSKKITPQKKPLRGEVGNLPAFYSHVDRKGFQSSGENEYDVAQAVGAKLPGLRSGDLLQAVIEQSIKASPSVPTPIRAMIIRGPFKGSFLLGTATLDRELKRVLIEFTQLRRPNTDQLYRTKATGLSMIGQVGLEGAYESQAGKFFIGEFAAGIAGGFADATTQRNVTPFGTYATEPSLANAGKQAGVNALSRSADRFAEGARSAPEWTELTSYQEIQVLIESDPTEQLN